MEIERKMANYCADEGRYGGDVRAAAAAVDVDWHPLHCLERPTASSSAPSDCYCCLSRWPVGQQSCCCLTRCLTMYCLCLNCWQSLTTTLRPN